MQMDIFLHFFPKNLGRTDIYSYLCTQQYHIITHFPNIVMKQLRYTLISLFLISSGIVEAQTSLPGNPIITHTYCADPSARVFGDTLWLFPSHDKDDAFDFLMDDFHAYSTTDMKTWTDHGVIYKPLEDTKWAKSRTWAPDCIERNGKYYFYYAVDRENIGVAVADSPAGPYHDPLGHPLISKNTPGVVCDRMFIDACPFIDDDGQAYLFVGQNTVNVIRLNEDMISYDGKVEQIQGVQDFFEAVWVHKRNDTYYMTYATSPFRRGKKQEIAYCTSKNPLGPYTYQGIILKPVNSGTTHCSIVNYKGQDYMFYHTADISRVLAPEYFNANRRSVSVDSLFYNEDGTIRPINMTINEEKFKLEDISDDRKMKLIAASVRLPLFPKDGKKITINAGTTRTELQKIIDECSDEGGGTITIPAGNYEMDGPIELKSNVRIHLSDGTTLSFTDDPNAYLPPVMSRYEGIEVYSRSPMIHAHWQENVAITGEGSATIDANGHEMASWGMTVGVESFEESMYGSHGETPERADVNRLREMGDKLVPLSDRVFGEDSKLRPCAIEFNSCSRVLFSGVTLKNSPFWCIHPLYCEDVIIKNVNIESNFPNNDGISPESSKKVLIENCTFRTGDDAVAVKSGRDTDGRRIGRPAEDIVIRNCKMNTKGNGICIGSEISGGVKNIFMSNIEIGNVKNGILFKSNLDRGGYIENVYVDSVKIGSTAGAALRFETNYLHYRGGNFPTRYNNFRINNVSVGMSDQFGIFYEGNEIENITDIKVKNFNVETAKWPYYLHNTKNCTFINCTVNKEPIPESPEESAVKRTCDVW